MRIYYIYYQLGAMQQTDNAQRTANAPPYATARLPIPLTPYIAASTYLAAYQQQLLEGTYVTGFAAPTAMYMQYIKYNNKRYRYVSSYLKIDYTDYRQTSSTPVHDYRTSM